MMTHPTQGGPMIKRIEWLRVTRIVCAMALLMTGATAWAERIKIGAEDAWYPYSGVVDGNPAGFTLELVRAAFATQKVDVEFVSLPYIRCMAEVKEGKLLACFNTARAPMVENDYLWPRVPMFDSASLIFARADHARRGLVAADLEGKRVAVTRGYEYGASFDGNKKIVRDQVNNDLGCLRMLAAGRVDYAVVYDRVSEQLLRDHGELLQGKVLAVGEIERLDLYPVFSKTFPGSRHYLDLFDKGFATIKKDGTLKALEKRWWQ
jgi:polar amino acid transport system substrate-binding protein